MTAWPKISEYVICALIVCGAWAGNNAVEMQTTAEFDQDADEFIINTPTTLAQKYWVRLLHNSITWQDLHSRVLLHREAFSLCHNVI